MGTLLKARRFGVLAVFAGCLWIGGCDDDDDDNGGIIDELQIREDYAITDMQSLLDSYLEEPVGLVDEWWFAEDFNLDGWGRISYLELFWDADDAVAIDDPDLGPGVETVYQGDNCTEYYDIFVTGAWSPRDMSLPVLTEFSVFGETECNGKLTSTLDGLWYYSALEDQQGYFMVTLPGPTWEYQAWAPARRPVRFDFIVDSVYLDGEFAYEATPEFVVTALERTRGAEILCDVQLTPYGTQSQQRVDVVCTTRLFTPGSPSGDLYGGQAPNIVSEELLLEQSYNSDLGRITAVLHIPNTIDPGTYSINIFVDNFQVGEDQAYATDFVSIPVDVFLP